MPGCMVVVGDTVEEAKAKRAQLDSLVHEESAIASLSITLGVDASKFDPDGPLPDDMPESNATNRAATARFCWLNAKGLAFASWRSASAVIPVSQWSVRQRASPMTWKNGWKPAAVTDLRLCSPICHRGWTTWLTG